MKTTNTLFTRTQEAINQYNKFKDEKALNTLYGVAITEQTLYYIAYAIATKNVIDMYDNTKKGSFDFEQEIHHLRNATMSIRFDEHGNIIDSYHIATKAADIIQAVATELCSFFGKQLSDVVQVDGKERMIKNLAYDTARKTAGTPSGYIERGENYITKNGKRAHRKTLIKCVEIDKEINEEGGALGGILVYERQNIQDYESAYIIHAAKKQIASAIDKKIFDLLQMVDYSQKDIAEELGITQQAVSKRIKAFAIKYPCMIEILQHKKR